MTAFVTPEVTLAQNLNCLKNKKGCPPGHPFSIQWRRSKMNATVTMHKKLSSINPLFGGIYEIEAYTRVPAVSSVAKGQSPTQFIQRYYSQYISINKDISRTAVKSPSNVRFYEISNATLRSYKYPRLTDADRRNGVDLKVAFSVKGTSYRYYDRNKDKTWSHWKNGSPAELS